MSALLTAAELGLLEAEVNHASASPRNRQRLHRAEQDLLLVRLAADTGARRGELAALRIEDLTGRTLRIDRAVSAGQITVPKSGRGRTLTIGADTATLWHRLAAEWSDRLSSSAQQDAAPTLGPWLFTADPAHRRRLGTEILGARFNKIRNDADVPDATLHRLRHTGDVPGLQGQVLQAQACRGHADAATTLREYCHALPATDGDARHQQPPSRDCPEPARLAGRTASALDPVSTACATMFGTSCS